MLFPPEGLRGGKVSFYTYQNIYDQKEETRLKIEVYRGNGYRWTWYVQDKFTSMAEALQYAKQWYLLFKLPR